MDPSNPSYQFSCTAYPSQGLRKHPHQMQQQQHAQQQQLKQQQISQGLELQQQLLHELQLQQQQQQYQQCQQQRKQQLEHQRCQQYQTYRSSLSDKLTAPGDEIRQNSTTATLHLSNNPTSQTTFPNAPLEYPIAASAMLTSFDGYQPENQMQDFSSPFALQAYPGSDFGPFPLRYAPEKNALTMMPEAVHMTRMIGVSCNQWPDDSLILSTSTLPNALARATLSVPLGAQPDAPPSARSKALHTASHICPPMVLPNSYPVAPPIVQPIAPPYTSRSVLPNVPPSVQPLAPGIAPANTPPNAPSIIPPNVLPIAPNNSTPIVRPNAQPHTPLLAPPFDLPYVLSSAQSKVSLIAPLKTQSNASPSAMSNISSCPSSKSHRAGLSKSNFETDEHQTLFRHPPFPHPQNNSAWSCVTENCPKMFTVGGNTSTNDMSKSGSQDPDHQVADNLLMSRVSHGTKHLIASQGESLADTSHSMTNQLFTADPSETQSRADWSGNINSDEGSCFTQRSRQKLNLHILKAQSGPIDTCSNQQLRFKISTRSQQAVRNVFDHGAESKKLKFRNLNKAPQMNNYASFEPTTEARTKPAYSGVQAESNIKRTTKLLRQMKLKEKTVDSALSSVAEEGLACPRAPTSINKIKSFLDNGFRQPSRETSRRGPPEMAPHSLQTRFQPSINHASSDTKSVHIDMPVCPKCNQTIDTKSKHKCGNLGHKRATERGQQLLHNEKRNIDVILVEQDEKAVCEQQSPATYPKRGRDMELTSSENQNLAVHNSNWKRPNQDPAHAVHCNREKLSDTHNPLHTSELFAGRTTKGSAEGDSRQKKTWNEENQILTSMCTVYAAVTTPRCNGNAISSDQTGVKHTEELTSFGVADERAHIPELMVEKPREHENAGQGNILSGNSSDQESVFSAVETSISKTALKDSKEEALNAKIVDSIKESALGVKETDPNKSDVLKVKEVYTSKKGFLNNIGLDPLMKEISKEMEMDPSKEEVLREKELRPTKKYALEANKVNLRNTASPQGKRLDVITGENTRSTGEGSSASNINQKFRSLYPGPESLMDKDVPTLDKSVSVENEALRVHSRTCARTDQFQSNSLSVVTDAYNSPSNLPKTPVSDDALLHEIFTLLKKQNSLCGDSLNRIAENPNRRRQVNEKPSPALNNSETRSSDEHINITLSLYRTTASELIALKRSIHEHSENHILVVEKSPLDMQTRRSNPGTQERSVAPSPPLPPPPPPPPPPSSSNKNVTAASCHKPMEDTDSKISKEAHQRNKSLCWEMNNINEGNSSLCKDMIKDKNDNGSVLHTVFSINKDEQELGKPFESTPSSSLSWPKSNSFTDYRNTFPDIGSNLRSVGRKELSNTCFITPEQAYHRKDLEITERNFSHRPHALPLESESINKSMNYMLDNECLGSKDDSPNAENKETRHYCEQGNATAYKEGQSDRATPHNEVEFLVDADLSTTANNKKGDSKVQQGGASGDLFFLAATPATEKSQLQDALLDDRYQKVIDRYHSDFLNRFFEIAQDDEDEGDSPKEIKVYSTPTDRGITKFLKCERFFRGLSKVRKNVDFMNTPLSFRASMTQDKILSDSDHDNSTASHAESSGLGKTLRAQQGLQTNNQQTEEDTYTENPNKSDASVFNPSEHYSIPSSNTDSKNHGEASTSSVPQSSFAFQLESARGEGCFKDEWFQSKAACHIRVRRETQPPDDGLICRDAVNTDASREPDFRRLMIHIEKQNDAKESSDTKSQGSVSGNKNKNHSDVTGGEQIQDSKNINNAIYGNSDLSLDIATSAKSSPLSNETSASPKHSRPSEDFRFPVVSRTPVLTPSEGGASISEAQKEHYLNQKLVGEKSNQILFTNEGKHNQTICKDNKPDETLICCERKPKLTICNARKTNQILICNKSNLNKQLICNENKPNKNVDTATRVESGKSHIGVRDIENQPSETQTRKAKKSKQGSNAEVQPHQNRAVMELKNSHVKSGSDNQPDKNQRAEDWRNRNETGAKSTTNQSPIRSSGTEASILEQILKTIESVLTPIEENYRKRSRLIQETPLRSPNQKEQDENLPSEDGQGSTYRSKDGAQSNRCNVFQSTVNNFKVNIDYPYPLPQGNDCAEGNLDSTLEYPILKDTSLSETVCYSQFTVLKQNAQSHKTGLTEAEMQSQPWENRCVCYEELGLPGDPSGFTDEVGTMVELVKQEAPNDSAHRAFELEKINELIKQDFSDAPVDLPNTLENMSFNEKANNTSQLNDLSETTSSFSATARNATIQSQSKTMSSGDTRSKPGSSSFSFFSSSLAKKEVQEDTLAIDMHSERPQNSDNQPSPEAHIVHSAHLNTPSSELRLKRETCDLEGKLMHTVNGALSKSCESPKGPNKKTSAMASPSAESRGRKKVEEVKSIPNIIGNSETLTQSMSPRKKAHDVNGCCSKAAVVLLEKLSGAKIRHLTQKHTTKTKFNAGNEMQSELAFTAEEKPENYALEEVINTFTAKQKKERPVLEDTFIDFEKRATEYEKMERVPDNQAKGVTISEKKNEKKQRTREGSENNKASSGKSRNKGRQNNFQIFRSAVTNPQFGLAHQIPLPKESKHKVYDCGCGGIDQISFPKEANRSSARDKVKDTKDIRAKSKSKKDNSSISKAHVVEHRSMGNEDHLSPLKDENKCKNKDNHKRKSTLKDKDAAYFIIKQKQSSKLLLKRMSTKRSNETKSTNRPGFEKKSEHEEKEKPLRYEECLRFSSDQATREAFEQQKINVMAKASERAVTTECDRTKGRDSDSTMKCISEQEYTRTDKTSRKLSHRTGGKLADQTMRQTFDQAVVETFGQVTRNVSCQATRNAFDNTGEASDPTTRKASDKTTKETSNEMIRKGYDKTKRNHCDKKRKHISDHTKNESFDSMTSKVSHLTIKKVSDKTIFGETTKNASDETRKMHDQKTRNYFDKTKEGSDQVSFNQNKIEVSREATESHQSSKNTSDEMTKETLDQAMASSSKQRTKTRPHAPMWKFSAAASNKTSENTMTHGFHQTLNTTFDQTCAPASIQGMRNTNDHTTRNIYGDTKISHFDQSKKETKDQAKTNEPGQAPRNLFGKRKRNNFEEEMRITFDQEVAMCSDEGVTRTKTQSVKSTPVRSGRECYSPSQTKDWKYSKRSCFSKQGEYFQEEMTKRFHKYPKGRNATKRYDKSELTHDFGSEKSRKQKPSIDPRRERLLENMENKDRKKLPGHSLDDEPSKQTNLETSFQNKQDRDTFDLPHDGEPDSHLEAQLSQGHSFIVSSSKRIRDNKTQKNKYHMYSLHRTSLQSTDDRKPDFKDDKSFAHEDKKKPATSLKLTRNSEFQNSKIPRDQQPDLTYKPETCHTSEKAASQTLYSQTNYPSVKSSNGLSSDNQTAMKYDNRPINELFNGGNSTALGSLQLPRLNSCDSTVRHSPTSVPQWCDSSPEHFLHAFVTSTPLHEAVKPRNASGEGPQRVLTKDGKGYNYSNDSNCSVANCSSDCSSSPPPLPLQPLRGSPDKGDQSDDYSNTPPFLSFYGEASGVVSTTSTHGNRIKKLPVCTVLERKADLHIFKDIKKKTEPGC